MNRLNFSASIIVLLCASPLAAQHKSLEELTKAVPLIVAAHVDSVDSFVGEGGEIYSTVRLEVASILKDTDRSEPSQLTFTVKGGQIGDRVVFFTDSPLFEAGEDILLFGSDSAPEEKVSLRGARGRAALERVQQYREDAGEALSDRESRRLQKFLDRPKLDSAEADSLEFDVTNACSAYIGPKWSSPSATYAIGTSLPAAWSASVQAAAQAWTQGGSRFAFVLDSKSPHAINLADLGAGSTLASTRVEYMQSSNTLVRFTMTFNNRYTWTTTGAAGQFDVQGITTHELGHALGLNHPGTAQCAEETMWSTASSGETKKRSLEGGDKNGILTLYGASALTPPPAINPPVTIPPAISTPVISYFSLVSTNPAASKPLVIVHRGSAFNPTTVEALITGGMCGSTGCVARPYGASATDLVFINIYQAGAYTMRLRNGAAGTLGISSNFTVVP